MAVNGQKYAPSAEKNRRQPTPSSLWKARLSEPRARSTPCRERECPPSMPCAGGNTSARRNGPNETVRVKGEPETTLVPAGKLARRSASLLRVSGQRAVHRANRKWSGSKASVGDSMILRKVSGRPSLRVCILDTAINDLPARGKLEPAFSTTVGPDTPA